MLIASRIAPLAAAFACVVALVIVGCMPTLAQQEASPQQIRQQLSDAREALEQEDYFAAEMVLQEARAALEGAAGEAAPPERDQLRVLIDAALDALHNEDYATALQTLQEAERMADEQQARAPGDMGEVLALLPDETPTRGIGGVSRSISGSADGDRAIRAARLFAGPGQFPPNAFAAYGIVAFRARAPTPPPSTEEEASQDAREQERKREHERHVMLCEAYVAALPRSAELTVLVEEQMATVWPIDDDELANRLNQLRGTDICDQAVDRYGLPTALQAINDAGAARIGRDRGPFLLAWSPSDAKGKPGAPMLIADLSDVTTYTQAEAFFVLWRTDIEANPNYWRGGWDSERLRVAIQLWVDRFGSQIFSVLGG